MILSALAEMVSALSVIAGTMPVQIKRAILYVLGGQMGMRNHLEGKRTGPAWHPYPAICKSR